MKLIPILSKRFSRPAAAALIVIVGVVSIIASTIPPIQPTGSWDGTDLSARYLVSISFPDASNGWAVGKNGDILHSSDGGISWNPQQQNVTTNNLNSVFFVNNQEGWAVGSGVVLHTVDGGLAWGTVPSLSGYITNYRQVFFLNNSQGWIVGGNQIWGTSNGSTWSQVNAFPSGTSLTGVHFVDPNHGWVVGKNGVVWIYDTGVWNLQISKTTKDLNSVYFIDPRVGFAVGGTSWTAGDEDGCTSGGLCGTPPGSPSQIMLYTTNSGAKWDAVFDQPGAPLLRVVFPDANNGWAVGGTEYEVSRWPSGNPQPVGVPRGVIKGTKDGGKTWTDQSSNFRPTYDIWLVKNSATPPPPATLFAIGVDSGRWWKLNPKSTSLYPHQGQYQKVNDPLTMVFKGTNGGWP